MWYGRASPRAMCGEALSATLDQETLRRSWMAISPVSYVDKYARWPKKTLLIHATCDLTFLPIYSRQLLDEFARRGLAHRSAVLPCGHYTTAEAPFKFLDAYYMASFLQSAFD